MATITPMIILFEGTGEDALFALFVLFAIIGGGGLFMYAFKLGLKFWYE